MKRELVVLDLVFAISASVLLFFWRQSRKTRLRRGYRLPPGPSGLLIIGNLFDMPESNEWVAYRDLGIKHGSDVISFSVYNTHTIVVNSAQAARDLFERRSAIYSDRPPMTAIRYLGVDSWNLGFLRYGSAWRVQRKMFHEHFKPEVLTEYEPHQKKAVYSFLRTLVTHPESTDDMDNLRTSIRHLTGSIIMHIAYGMEIQSQNDPYLLMLEKAVLAINQAAQLSGVILDLFPFLQSIPAWFPGAGFKRYAAKVRPDVGEAVKDKPWDVFISGIESQSPHAKYKRASVAGRLLQKHGDDPTLLEAMKAVPGVMYVGGTDTSVSALSSFFLAMVLYPDAQLKAQQELDSFLGGTLPTLSSREHLPYTTALVKEVFRWHPPLSLGVAHATIADDIYKDMFIPAGSTVIGNTWAMLHDSALFPKPEVFDPMHYIPTGEGGLYPAGACIAGEPEFPEVVFGFGRRICPGRLLAKDSVWLTVASVLSMFNISSAKDDTGMDIPVTETWLSGVIGFPGPYRCTIKPRSQIALETVMSTAEGEVDEK